MTVRLIVGDCRERLAELPDRSVQCCVTSPPYFGLRDYGCDGQIGLESTPEAFVLELVSVFREVRRVLRDDGVLFLNLGDSYANDTKWGASSSSGKHVTALLGDSGIGRRRHMTGLKSKNLIGIPWMVAFALRADGWYLRQDIIWAKPNPMPESVTDRCTKAHEYLFLLSKSARYHFDADAIAEGRTQDEDANGFRGGCYVGGATDNATLGKRATVGNIRKSDSTNASFVPGASDHGGLHRAGRSRGLPPRHAAYPESSDQSGLDDVGRGGKRNKRSVWTVATAPFSEAHFATFPPALIEPCILAGCPKGGTVLDPFGGAGTTGLVADRLGRDCTLIELNPAYAVMAENRLRDDAGMFAQVATGGPDGR